jgi:hypothetical protein
MLRPLLLWETFASWPALAISDMLLISLTVSTGFYPLNGYIMHREKQPGSRLYQASERLVIFTKGKTMTNLTRTQLAPQQPAQQKERRRLPIILIVILISCCVLLLCCCAVAAILLLKNNHSSSRIQPTVIATVVNSGERDSSTTMEDGISEVVVEPSTDPQTVTFGDVSVTIPGGLLSSSETLKVTELTDAPPPNFKGLGMGGAYDIQLGELHQFDQPIMINLHYDASVLRDDISLERCISVAYFDDNQGVWVETPATIDQDKQEIAVATRHLTKWGWFMWLRGYPVIENDRFTLVYDPNELNDPMLGPVYSVTDDSNHVDANVPDYIEDAQVYLDFAFHRYKAAGFKVPPTPINVYIGGSDPSQRGKFFGHGLSINLNSMNQAQLKMDTAHELFHSFEGAYLTAVGMGTGELPGLGWTLPIVSWSVWYVESAAEYAAEYVVWDGALGQMGGLKKIRYDYLSYPLWDISENHNYGYHTAHFVKFLVDGGANFKAMSEYLFNFDWWNMNDYYYPMHEYLEITHGRGNGLPRQYQNFARFYIFDANSPMPALTDSLHSEVAAYRSTMSGNPQESATFDLKGGYTAKLWGIWFSESLFDQNTAQRTYKVSLDGALASKVEVDVVVLKGDKRVAGGSTPVGTLNQTTTSVDVEVEQGDAVYVLAVNVDSPDHQVKVKISESTGLKVTSNRDNVGIGDITPTIHTEWIVDAPGASLAPEGSGALVYVSGTIANVRARVTSVTPPPDYESCYDGECSEFKFIGFTGKVELWHGSELLATASGPDAWMDAYDISMAGTDYVDLSIRVYYSYTYKKWDEETGEILTDGQWDDQSLGVNLPIEKR